jgi:hypothetical protein
MTDVRQQATVVMDGPPINMFLKARVDGSGKFVDWDLGQNNPPARGKAPANVPKGDGCNIVVRLVATPGVNASFKVADPAWIQKGGNCPPRAGNNCPDQIDQVSATSNTLTLHDTNTLECTIIYQMNFDGGVPPCDPEIRNGGKTVA